MFLCGSYPSVGRWLTLQLWLAGEAGHVLLEVEVLEGKVHLDDAGGFDSGAQDILLGWLVVFGAQSLQVVQEAVQKQRTMLEERENIK